MRFLVDRMLGRLSRGLRMLGFDASYANLDRPAALRLRAAREGRVLLTRNRRLRGMPRVFIIESEDWPGQVREVLRTLGLEEAANPFGRCLACNLALQPIDRENVKGRVPHFIHRHHRKFMECAGCGRIFWPGSHRSTMARRLRAMFHVKRST